MREEFREWGLLICTDSLSVTLDAYVVTGLCVPHNEWEVLAWQVPCTLPEDSSFLTVLQLLLSL